MKRLRFAFATLALSLPLAAAPLLGQEPVKLKIRFVSDKDIKPNRPVRLEAPIALGKVTDARQQDNPMLLGQSEARKPPVPVETLTPIPALVEEALRTSLSEWKVDVQPGANRVLACEVLELKTEEEHRVGADVRLRFLLESEAGAVLWKGEVKNDDSTWGKSLSEKNYSQVISTALKRAIADLFNNRDFRDALESKS
jgi:hypothetical protein